MTDAPERIWAWWFIESKRDDVIKGGWDDVADRKSIEYIRADLARPMTVAEAAKMDDRAARVAMHEEMCGCLKGPDCPRCDDYMRGFAAALRALSEGVPT